MIYRRTKTVTKKQKTAICILIVAGLIAATFAGCNGAKEQEEAFIPNTFSILKASSSFICGPVTDTETVGYLWSLYQSFEIDDDEETQNKENMHGITVIFVNSESGIRESFTVFQSGICQLGDDCNTTYVLINGAEIYNDIMSIYEAAQ